MKITMSHSLFSFLSYMRSMAMGHVPRVRHTLYIYKYIVLGHITLLCRFDKEFKYEDNSFLLDSCVGGLLVPLRLLLILESSDLLLSS